MIMKKLSEYFSNLDKKNRIMLLFALLLTVAMIIAIPVLAWFSDQRKMATMAKIDSPAKLSLKSGAKEDIVQFKMSGIDVNQPSPKYFVFCVEGEDISSYNIQLAHTTNINFSYSIYKATESVSETSVEYVKTDTTKVYYAKAGSPLPGVFINASQDTVDTSRWIGNVNYEASSYDNENDPDARQKFAEPLYWQTSTPIQAQDAEYDDDSEDGSFRNYYVLEVSWGEDVVNDKETDMVYLTVQVA